MLQFDGLEALRLAVLEDLEVVLVRFSMGLPSRSGDGDIDHDELDFGAEDRILRDAQEAPAQSKQNSARAASKPEPHDQS